MVHGGPGSALSTLGHTINKMWKGMFTLVFWDQRGSGKTLMINGDPMSYSITKDDLLEDMHHITEHLKERYNKKKIAVLGMSWGSVLGTAYAQAHPENLSMYIGMVQVTSWKRNWTAAYEKVVELAAKDPKDMAIVKSWGGVPPWVPDKSGKYPKESIELGKLKQKYNIVMKLTPKLALDYFLSPTFTFKDMPVSKDSNKINKHLLDYLFSLDFEREYPPLYKVPVSYILGDRDYQAVWSLAVDYFNRIEAPWKLLKVIHDASHNVPYDQPKAAAEAMREIRGVIQE
jgi:pimeloyl-ACP methyl ester carboxylesterase